ncbi:hypothetical protein AKJ16_DCAP23146 [Drosera capensis]
MINHIGERGRRQLDLSPPLFISFPLSINAITVTQNDVVFASLSLSRRHRRSRFSSSIKESDS